MSGYLSLSDLKDVPRLQEDFYWLGTDDYIAWRTYARELAVKLNIRKGIRPRVAGLIDDVMSGDSLAAASLSTLRTLLPGVKAPIELAETGQIGKRIRIQALTSDEWKRVQAAQEDATQNSDWVMCAYGLHTPSLRADDDLDAAVEIVRGWPQHTVYQIALRLMTLTLNPAGAKKGPATDSFTSFFDSTGSSAPPAGTQSLSLVSAGS